jgi:hypothetical protein
LHRHLLVLDSNAASWQQPLVVPADTRKLTLTATMLPPLAAHRYYPVVVELHDPYGVRRRWDDLFTGTKLELDTPTAGVWSIIARYDPARSQSAFAAINQRIPATVKARLEIQLARHSAVDLRVTPERLDLGPGERRELSIEAALTNDAALNLGELGWYGECELHDAQGPIARYRLELRATPPTTATRRLAELTPPLWDPVARVHTALRDVQRPHTGAHAERLLAEAEAEAHRQLAAPDRLSALQLIAQGTDDLVAAAARAVLHWVARERGGDATWHRKLAWIRQQEAALDQALSSLGTDPFGIDGATVLEQPDVLSKQMHALAQPNLTSTWRTALERRSDLVHELSQANSSYRWALQQRGMDPLPTCASIDELLAAEAPARRAWLAQAGQDPLARLLGALARQTTSDVVDELAPWIAWLETHGIDTQAVELVRSARPGLRVIALQLPDSEGRGGRSAVIIGTRCPLWRALEAVLEGLQIASTRSARLAHRLPAPPLQRRAIARAILRILEPSPTLGAQPVEPLERRIWLGLLDRFARRMIEEAPNTEPQALWADLLQDQLAIPTAAQATLPLARWLLDDPAAPAAEILVEVFARKLSQPWFELDQPTRMARIAELLRYGNQADGLRTLLEATPQ